MQISFSDGTIKTRYDNGTQYVHLCSLFRKSGSDTVGNAVGNALGRKDEQVFTSFVHNDTRTACRRLRPTWVLSAVLHFEIGAVKTDGIFLFEQFSFFHDACRKR